MMIGTTIYEKRHLANESYDDKKVKDVIISHSLELFGFNVCLNTLSDLIACHDPSIRIEVERGGPVYGHWGDGYYDTLSGHGVPTVNMPDRKEYYWMEYYRRWNKERAFFMDKDVVYNPSYIKNIFCRSDFFFNQFIIVEADVIIDASKTLRKRYKVKNNGVPENWLSWKKEHVKTYNLIDDHIILETDNLLTHLPIISIEMRKDLQNEKDKEKAEQARIKKELNQLRINELCFNTDSKK